MLSTCAFLFLFCGLGSHGEEGDSSPPSAGYDTLWGLMVSLRFAGTMRNLGETSSV